MKTAQQIQTMISEIIVQRESDTKLYKRLKKKQDELTVCLRYLNSKPDADFVKAESKRLSNRINMFMEGYKPLSEVSFTKGECTKHKRNFEKEMGIPKVRKQLTVLNFILAK